MTRFIEECKLTTMSVLRAQDLYEEERKMPVMEEAPYVEIMRDWFKRMGYAPVRHEDQIPVQPQGRIRRLTKKERERVESLSRERGYREFCAFVRAR